MPEGERLTPWYLQGQVRCSIGMMIAKVVRDDDLEDGRRSRLHSCCLWLPRLACCRRRELVMAMGHLLSNHDGGGGNEIHAHSILVFVSTPLTNFISNDTSLPPCDNANTRNMFFLFMRGSRLLKYEPVATC